MYKFEIGDYVKVTSGQYEDIICVVEKVYNEYEEIGVASKDVFCKVRPINVKEDILLTLHENILEKVEMILFEESINNESFNQDDEMFIEMATVKGGFMSIKLSVYDKEGKYPHFHFYKGLKPEGGIPYKYRKGGGCICLDRPNYFKHSKHTETMTPKEIKRLIEFLKSPNESIITASNWEVIVSLWNMNNSDQPQLSLRTPIPNYESDMESITD